MQLEIFSRYEREGRDGGKEREILKDIFEYSENENESHCRTQNQMVRNTKYTKNNINKCAFSLDFL